jgi:predicted unusual protein kinase regulating ubiquinone biosynthesis (AarF/ABC1/UbiB family)
MIQSRYRRILFFFARVILSFIAWDLLLPRLGLGRLSRHTRAARLRRIASQFRGLAVRMGGVMIKVGQFLSARLDVLPVEITDELSGLQDEVQSEPFSAVKTVIEADLNGPLEAHFSQFEQQPLASASIGQVHRARFGAGENVAGTDQAGIAVVVKAQRPNIEQIVETDLAALRIVSRWIHYYPPIRRRVDSPALLEEFSRSLYEEIDYLLEGKNAETFAANFAGRPGIRVPEVYWSHTTRRVLTLEEIHGIKITDYQAIDAAGIDRVEVAERLFQTYLKQIFEDRFFHADPHPGNLFVRPRVLNSDAAEEQEGPAWDLVFVDFGMTGKVSPEQMTALREILIAVGLQDVPRLIRAYQRMGILLPSADTKTLEKATRRVFDQFWGKSTTEIVNLGQQEAASFAREFGSLLYELPFQIPENLILLGRCVGILSGMCTGLDPNFNVWNSMMPYVRRLVEAEGQGRNVLVEESLNLLKAIVSLPARTDALIQRIEQGQLAVQIPELKQSIAMVEKRLRQLTGAILFAALLAGAIQFQLAESIWLAAALGAGAVLALLWLLSGR